MTNRQKEFARHYVAGMSAHKAAIAAGYAASTAERNAAHFLEHPAVYTRICQLRLHRHVITQDDLQTARYKIMHVIEHISDPTLLLKASHELCRLARMQQKLELDDYGRLKEDCIEAAWQIDHIELAFQDLENPGTTQERLHEIDAQLTDIEGNKVEDFYAQAPNYFDHTPQGTLAFDQPKRILFEGSSPRTQMSQGSSLAFDPEIEHPVQGTPVQGLQALEPSLPSLQACPPVKRMVHHPPTPNYFPPNYQPDSQQTLQAA